jgi:hypothetical protein
MTLITEAASPTPGPVQTASNDEPGDLLAELKNLLKDDQWFNDFIKLYFTSDDIVG